MPPIKMTRAEYQNKYGVPVESPYQEPQGVEPNYFQRVGEDFNARRTALEEVNKRQATGQQTFPETVLQHAGQVAGGVTDIVSELPVVRNIFGMIGKGVQSLSETKPIQALGKVAKPAVSAVVNKYQGLSPRAKSNISSAVNVASILPLGKAGQVAGKSTGEVLGEAATKSGIFLEKSGLKSAKAELENFARKLTRPEPTPAVKLAEVPRTTETGLFNKDIVAPT